MVHLILCRIFVISLSNLYVAGGTANNWLTNAKRAVNSSNNESQADKDTAESDELSVVMKVIYGIVIPVMVVICVTGNILTIVSYAQDRKLRTVHNTYLISLATSDILIGCVSMPFYAVYTLTSYRWPFGVAFCKIFMSIDFLACLESVLVIMLVSYDRCMLLVQGAAYSTKQTIRAAKIRIFISWAIAFVVYVPAIVFWDLVRGYSAVDEGDCNVEFFDEFSFIMATSVMEFLLPFIIISTLNIYLYSLILKRSREMPGKKAPEKSRKAELSGNVSSGADVTDGVKVAITRERKAARSLAILVSVFTVCWMPYTVCTVIIAFCQDCVHENLYEAFNWLLWANSTLNPFLYAFTNAQFRLNFIRLLRIEKICCTGTKVAPNSGDKGISTIM